MPSISSATGEAPAQHSPSTPAEQRPLPPMTRDRPFAWLLLITGVVGWLASGALVLSNYGEMLGEVTPLAVEVTIRYLKVARGPVTATAHMASKADAVIATLKAGGRPEFHVEVELTTGEGDDRLVTGAVTVLWTLKPNKRPETA